MVTPVDMLAGMCDWPKMIRFSSPLHSVIMVFRALLMPIDFITFENLELSGLTNAWQLLFSEE